MFYPIHSSEAHGPFMAGYDTRSRLSEATLGVHLWNTMLRLPSSLRPGIPAGRLVVEPGSFVEEFAREEFGMRVESE